MCGFPSSKIENDERLVSDCSNSTRCVLSSTRTEKLARSVSEFSSSKSFMILFPVSVSISTETEPSSFSSSAIK